MRTTRLGGGGVEVTIPRFFVSDTQQAAELLSQRLNRASTIAYMTTQYPEDRRGADHETFIAACLAELEELDPGAPSDAKYSVGEVVAFSGPAESSVPFATALMQAFQASAKPPDNILQALFRVLRDLGI